MPAQPSGLASRRAQEGAWLRRYLVVANRNATGLAARFRDLNGLQLLLLNEVDSMAAGRAQTLGQLQRLTADCDQPSDAFIMQASARPSGLSAAVTTPGKMHMVNLLQLLSSQLPSGMARTHGCPACSIKHAHLGGLL